MDVVFSPLQRGVNKASPAVKSAYKIVGFFLSVKSLFILLITLHLVS